MSFLSVYVIILFATQNSIQDITDVTLDVNDRIALLKHQIKQQIKEKQRAFEIPPLDNEDFTASYEYVDNSNKPITPIMESDERKKGEKYKLRELKTTLAKTETPTEKAVKGDKDGGVKKQDGVKNNQTKPLRGKNKNSLSKKPTETFYRRMITGDFMHMQPYVHCQDLITPFFMGTKTNLTNSKRITHDNYIVLRLMQLLSEDTSDDTKDEIYSVLYQINNLQIRLFQWDVAAIKLLLNTINKEHTKTHNMHTFRSVKAGLKRLFDSWHLDFTNTTNLLRQARIFRPPCMQVSPYGGSTKTSKAFRFTKSVKPRCEEGMDKAVACY